MQDLPAALQMIDLFVSVGATHFDLTLTDIDGEKRTFRASQSVNQLKNSLPKLFPGAAARRNNIIIRPSGGTSSFVQLDDLNDESLKRVGDASFMKLETSPGNYQAWVAVSKLPTQQEEKDFARRLRKGAGADVNASGATRVAGTVNYKRKYEPEFPTVTVRDSAPGQIVTPTQLEARGLLAPVNSGLTVSPTPARVSRRSEAAIRAKKWPDYQRCLENAPPNHGGSGPDSSRADFTWCMMALDWGFSIPETLSKLVEVSSKARENGQRYAVLTVQNAAAAVERRNPKAGRG